MLQYTVGDIHQLIIYTVPEQQPKLTVCEAAAESDLSQHEISLHAVQFPFMVGYSFSLPPEQYCQVYGQWTDSSKECKPKLESDADVCLSRGSGVSWWHSTVSRGLRTHLDYYWGDAKEDMTPTHLEEEEIPRRNVYNVDIKFDSTGAKVNINGEQHGPYKYFRRGPDISIGDFVEQLTVSVFSNCTDIYAFEVY